MPHKCMLICSSRLELTSARPSPFRNDPGLDSVTCFQNLPTANHQHLPRSQLHQQAEAVVAVAQVEVVVEEAAAIRSIISAWKRCRNHAGEEGRGGCVRNEDGLVCVLG